MGKSGGWKNITRGTIRAEVAAQFPRFAARTAASVPRPVIDPSALVLGLDQQSRPAVISQRARMEHTHVIGTTGGGKTNFLAHCIKQDIEDGRGVCVVDPHGNHPGSLYRWLLAWLESSGISKRRVVHLIDPNASSHTVGFNPLRVPPGYDASVIADTTLEAFSRVWGDENLQQKPTITRVLTATFLALAELGLTLAEAGLLFDPHDVRGVRRHVTRNLKNRHARDVWESLNQLALDEGKNKREFRAEVVGPMNRLVEFVSNDAVRAILGQTDCTIDFASALDEGHIILANLSGGMLASDKRTEILGRLLIRYLFFFAKERRRPERPFFVFWMNASATCRETCRICSRKSASSALASC